MFSGASASTPCSVCANRAGVSSGSPAMRSILMFPWPSHVSYTHLDVYKRQGIICPVGECKQQAKHALSGIDTMFLSEHEVPEVRA